jgi:hypothetical protein
MDAKALLSRGHIVALVDADRLYVYGTSFTSSYEGMRLRLVYSDTISNCTRDDVP